MDNPTQSNSNPTQNVTNTDPTQPKYTLQYRIKSGVSYAATLTSAMCRGTVFC